jgi:hypothetical protein
MGIVPLAVDPKLDVFKLLFTHSANRNLVVSLLLVLRSPRWLEMGGSDPSWTGASHGPRSSDDSR